MLSKVNLAYFGVLAVLPHLALAADSLPNTSVESICRDAQSAALPDSKAAAYQSCLHEEGAARDLLRRNWARYSAQARATCAEPGGVQVSYVELQTCLDMQTGGSLARPIPGAGGASSLGAIPAPPPAPGQKQ